MGILHQHLLFRLAIEIPIPVVGREPVALRLQVAPEEKIASSI
jgi:hypothetical protein